MRGFRPHPPRDPGRLALCWLALLAGLLLAPVLWADSSLERTDEVKAAFILNIARFVEWPADRADSDGRRLWLCFYRRNPFGAAIQTIRGKRVAGRELSVKRVGSAAEEHACHILFVPRGELGRFSRESEGAAGRPLLTITDLTSGARGRKRPDVMIVFVRQGKRMGFEINLDAVRRTGLQISSELLKLGRIVGTP